MKTNTRVEDPRPAHCKSPLSPFLLCLTPSLIWMDYNLWSNSKDFSMWCQIWGIISYRTKEMVYCDKLISSFFKDNQNHTWKTTEKYTSLVRCRKKIAFFQTKYTDRKKSTNHFQLASFTLAFKLFMIKRNPQLKLEAKDNRWQSPSPPGNRKYLACEMWQKLKTIGHCPNFWIRMNLAIAVGYSQRKVPFWSRPSFSIHQLSSALASTCLLWLPWWWG